MNLFIKKIYTWSIVVEPLLFFVLTHRAMTGISISISRILQLITGFFLVILFFFRLSSGKFNLPIIRFKNHIFHYIYVYILLLIFSGLFINDAIYTEGLKNTTDSVVNSQSNRKIFEYFIQIYYVVYFMMMPVMVFNKKNDIDYFFKVFKWLFFIGLFAGFADILSIILFNFDPLPRHILGWKNVGLRFHGFAGEPRHAVAYLMLGISILYLSAFYYKKKLNKLLIATILLAMILTQSMSFIVGIVSFMFLYFVFSSWSVGNLLNKITIIISSIAVMIISVAISERVLDYINAMTNVWYILESNKELPYLMRVQATSIYPIYDIIKKFIDFDIIPVLLGSGLGSASEINNVYLGNEVFLLKNPNAQIVRIIYESGIVGLYVFIIAFLYPVKRIVNNLHNSYKIQFTLLILMMLAMFFAVRSSVLYLYFGVFIAVFNIIYKEEIKSSDIKKRS